MIADIGTQLADFAVRTRCEDVPADVVDFAKCLNLKTMAGMLVGATKVSGRKMAAFIKQRHMPEQVGVIGCGFKATVWDTALAHGFFAHASELEDDRGIAGFDYPGLAWDITVIPLLASLAQQLKLSGKALTEAIIAGMEIHVRTSLFHNPFLETAFWTGAVGPAAAAAKALGLDVQGTVAAMGLALSSNAVTNANAGTDGHYFESSLHCLQGIMAAEMAKANMRGNPNIGRYLSKILGKERVAPEVMVADLGRRWRLTEMMIKKYPTCTLTHRQTDALVEILREHNLSYQQIENVESNGGPSDKTVDRPEPKIEEDLPFSMQHNLGVIMVYGDITREHVSEHALKDPKLQEARSKVKVVLHRDWTPGVNLAPAIVTVRTKDGREFTKERMNVIGSPQEPLTVEQFRGLYMKHCRGILSEKDISKTADALLNLEKLSEKEVAELLNTLVFKARVDA